MYKNLFAKMQVRSAAAQHTAVGAEMHRLCQQSQVQRIPGGVLGSNGATPVRPRVGVEI